MQRLARVGQTLYETKRIFSQYRKAQVLLWPLLLLILILIGALISNGNYHRRENEATTSKLEELNRKYESLRDEQLRRDNQQKLRDSDQDNKDKELEGKIVQRDLQRRTNAVLASVRPALPIGCENYRPLIAQYSWPVEAAMTVMSKESGCNPYAVSPTNDHGLFQLNAQPVYTPAENIAIAYGKYVGGRVGANNWSAWYAVCTPGNYPQPKYPGINCI